MVWLSTLWLLATLTAPSDLEVIERLESVEVLEIEEGPGVFEIEPLDEATWKPWFTPGELAWMRQHRSDLAPRLLSALEERDSRLAALLLAWIGESKALPELRRLLLSDLDTYGWETSTPRLFEELNHHGYHASSRAIEALSGQPLEATVTLSASEIAVLAETARNDEGGAALMILHRLAPVTARSLVFELFRGSQGWRCLAAGYTVLSYKLVPPGMPQHEALVALGPPSALRGETAVYCCSAGVWSGDFRLRFEGGRVAAFESEMQEDDDAARWCPHDS